MCSLNEHFFSSVTLHTPAVTSFLDYLQFFPTLIAALATEPKMIHNVINPIFDRLTPFQASCLKETVFKNVF